MMKKAFYAAVSLLFAACSGSNLIPGEEIDYLENDVLVTRGEQVAATTSDSLALVAIYRAFNGENTKLNWKEGVPVYKWQGVGLDKQGRVVELNVHGWRGEIKGTIAPEVGQLTALKIIDFEGNPNLVGSICPELYNLTELRTLRLRYTGITGELSESIGNLTKLDTLDIRKPYDEPYYKPEDEMTGKLPVSIAKLTNLRYLDLDNNEFSGTLPEEWGALENLVELRISSSQLTGGIPDSYGNMKSITQFSLSYNKLNKPVPASLGQLQNLDALNLSHNQISGSIPSELANAPKLRVIDLNYNRLTGSIPASLSDMKSLGILWVRDNQLTGTVDSKLGSNGRMTSMELQNNNLEGSLPDLQMIYLIGGPACCDLVAYGNRFAGELNDTYLFFEEQFRKNLLPQQEGYGFSNLK